MKFRLACWPAFLLTLLSFAKADGLIRDGHPFGPYTTVTLTAQQIAKLEGGQEEVELTEQQFAQVARATGVTGGRTIRVFPKTYDDCACELKNVGVRVASNSVEISHMLYERSMFRDDAKHDLTYWAEKRAEEVRRDDAELARANPPVEVQLFGEGVLLNRKGDYVAAAKKFREAYKANPKYGPARRKVAEELMGSAWNAMIDHEDDRALIRRYDEILNVMDPDDSDTTREVKKMIESAKRRIAAGE